MSQAKPGTIETRVVDGLALAKTIRKELGEEIGALVAQGKRAPSLAVVLVGDDPASEIYVRNKAKQSHKAGMNSDVVRLPADAAETELLATVERRKKLASTVPDPLICPVR